MVPKCQRDILRIYLLKGRACATQDGIKFISSTLTLSKNALYFFFDAKLRNAFELFVRNNDKTMFFLINCAFNLCSNMHQGRPRKHHWLHRRCSLLRPEHRSQQTHHNGNHISHLSSHSFLFHYSSEVCHSNSSDLSYSFYYPFL